MRAVRRRCPRLVALSLGALCLLSPTSRAAESDSPGKVTVAWRDAIHPVLHGKPQNDLGELNFVWSGAEPVALETLVFRMDEGSAPLEELALYAADEEGRPLWNRPLAAAVPNAAEVRLQAGLELQPGENRFRVGCTLHADATLDQRVTIACTRVDLAQGAVALDPAPRSLSHRVGVALRRAGQDGVHTYRIPVLATTPTGTLLCAYDIRRDSSRDLQGDIDVGLSRSLDGGRTWEPMQVIMDMGEWGGLSQAQNGIGDPGLVVDQQTGDIFCFAVWMHGKPGKHQWRGDGSEPGFDIGKTAQFMMVRSQDDGVTWSEPVNLTRQLKAEEWILLAPSPQQGIQLADGALAMPIQGRDDDGAFAALMLSDDHGQTWTVSRRAYSGGNECQAAELADGTIMLNIRNGGKKRRAVVTTANRGRDWQLHPTHEQALIEPTCNGSLYRWTSQAGGPADDWLLFVNPRNERRRTHFTLHISADQGMTWPESQQVLLDEGAGFGYPSVSRVDDEHVGVVYEGSQSHLVFERFSRGALRQTCFAEQPQESVCFARFEYEGAAQWGVVQGDQVQCIDGAPLDGWRLVERRLPLAEVRLLAPVTPAKALAVGLNYRSHIGSRPVPQVPEIFFKLPTSIVGPEEPIVLPRDATDVHYEAELVVVIGRRGRHIPVEQAGEYVFGVTCGNDVSERQWQKNDLQWWRAKGCDAFGPCGPYLVTGLNYDDLLLTLRHNGEVKQQERTSDLVHSVADIVSWVSRYVTLEPGDVIFTGTPGSTRPMADGDVVEVELEGVGVLRNPVRRER